MTEKPVVDLDDKTEGGAVQGNREGSMKTETLNSKPIRRDGFE